MFAPSHLKWKDHSVVMTPPALRVSAVGHITCNLYKDHSPVEFMSCFGVVGGNYRC